MRKHFARMMTGVLIAIALLMTAACTEDTEHHQDRVYRVIDGNGIPNEGARVLTLMRNHSDDDYETYGIAFHTNGTPLQEGVYRPSRTNYRFEGWFDSRICSSGECTFFNVSGSRIFRSCGECVIYFDDLGERISSENMEFPPRSRLYARWTGFNLVTPPEPQRAIFQIRLFRNVGYDYSDNLGIAFRTSNSLHRLTAHDLVLIVSEDDTGYVGDLSRIEQAGYEFVAWTRVRQETPFYGSLEEAIAFSSYNMGGRIGMGMQIGDIFNCPVWRLNIRYTEEAVILDVFAFWRKEDIEE